MEYQTQMDNLETSYPEANIFINLLRQQIERVDSIMNKAIYQFRTNHYKQCIYANCTTDKEVYISILYDYLGKIDTVNFLDFKLPSFGIEAIEFRIKTDNIEYKLPNDDILRRCIGEKLSLMKI
tara:strand:- start:175 stop:546 length:372 start_codon:yes stop_codon:yes gene_type:complete